MKTKQYAVTAMVRFNLGMRDGEHAAAYQFSSHPAVKLINTAACGMTYAYSFIVRATDATEAANLFIDHAAVMKDRDKGARPDVDHLTWSGPREIKRGGK